MISPMAFLYEQRKKLIEIYGKHSFVIQILLKFVTALLMMICIHKMSGYVMLFSNIPVTIILAIVCAFLPWGIISTIMCILLVVQYTGLSMIVAAFAFAIMFVMILLDTIFAPGCGKILFFVPLAFFFKLPFLLPLILGMVAPVTCLIPLAFGTILYYMMVFVNSFAGVLTNAEDVTMTDTALQLLNGLVTDRFMVLVTLAMIATTIVVYVIHRMSVDHAWSIALAIGAVLDVVLILMGSVSSQSSNSMGVFYVIFGSIVSVIIAFLVRFMIFSVDYKQTEYTQFEDDEYYYYVKAVPKIKVTEKVYDKIDIVADTPVEKAGDKHEGDK